MLSTRAPWGAMLGYPEGLVTNSDWAEGDTQTTTTAGPVTSAYRHTIAALPRVLGNTRKVWRSLNNPRVERDAKNRIVGPAYQAVLSPLHGDNGKTPANLNLLLKATLLIGGMWFFGEKADIIKSPTNLTSFMDAPSEYLDGASLPSCVPGKDNQVHGETCYFPGGTYYQHALQDPEHAVFWDWMPGLNQVDRSTLNWMVYLLGIGLLALPFYKKENSRLFENVPEPKKVPERRDAKGGLITLENGIVVEIDGITDILESGIQVTQENGSVVSIDKNGRITDGDGPLKDLPFGTVFTLADGRRATLVEKYLYRERIGNLAAWAWTAAFASYVTVAYASSQMAGRFQFQEGGSPDLLGHWTEWDWHSSVIIGLFGYWMGKMLLAAPMSRTNPLTMNLTSTSYVAVSRLIHGEPSSMTSRIYASIFAGVGVTAILGLGAEGVYHLFDGSFDRTLWYPFWMAASAGALMLTGERVFGNGNWAKAIFPLVSGREVDRVRLPDYMFAREELFKFSLAEKNHIKEGTNALIRGGRVFMTLFAPRRLGYSWIISTMTAGSVNLAFAAMEEAMQGVGNEGGYYRTITELAFLGPGRFNYIAYSVNGGMTGQNPSGFGFLAPGFFTIFVPERATARVAQGLSYAYSFEAQNYAVGSPEERPAILAELLEDEALLHANIAHGGYGDERIQSRAQAELRRVEFYKNLLVW